MTATISDHLPQFAIIHNMFGNTSSNKSNIHERDSLNLIKKLLFLTIFSVDLEDLLKIDELNAENLTHMYLDKINMLLDTYILERLYTKRGISH